MFKVRVIADNTEDSLKKGQIFTVLDIHWANQALLERDYKLFFLIYNPKTGVFMYYLSGNFELYTK